MNVTAGDIFDFINTFAPFDAQAKWDNAGFLAGDKAQAVTAAVCCLDVTDEEIMQAKRVGAQLIISHHPLIFNPIKSILSNDVTYKLAQNNLSVISAHTNLDKAPDGVNDALCARLGMTHTKLPSDVADGFLNVGTIDRSLTPAEFAKYISEKLNTSVDFVEGDTVVNKIAVCSGSGADFVPFAIENGCNAFVTGDAAYHEFLDAKKAGVSLFAAGHFETETFIADVLCEKLCAEFPDVKFYSSERKAPIKTVI